MSQNAGLLPPASDHVPLGSREHGAKNEYCIDIGVSLPNSLYTV